MVVLSYSRRVAGPRRAAEDPDRYGRAGTITDSKADRSSWPGQRSAQTKASTFPCLVLVRDIVLLKL